MMLIQGQPHSAFIVCADISAEAYAWDFIAALPEKPIHIQAIGGDYLKKKGVVIWKNNHHLSVIGFLQCLIKLPRILLTFIQTIRHIKKSKPSMLILVDAGAFNMRLIRATCGLNIPTYYMMPPRLSLSGMPQHSNITFIHYYDFEKDKLAELNAHQVRHPKVDLIVPQSPPQLPIKQLAFFPGSRYSELKHHIPILEALRHAINMHVTYYIQQPHNQQLAEKLGVPKHIISHLPPQDVAADFAICSSGTITLELALRGIPMICIYRLRRIDFLLIKQLVKVQHIALPNLILDEKLVPELIQDDCSVETIAKKMHSLTQMDLQNQIKGFALIRENLSRSHSLEQLLAKKSAMVHES